MWRNLRILVLLLILLCVALNSYFQRRYATDWNIPLRVTIYPINGDGSPTTEQFVARLRSQRFQSLETFFQREAHRHGLQMERPIQFKSAPQLRDQPPTVKQGANVLSVMAWSLRMRYWAWRVPKLPGAAPDVKLFVVYHDPAITPTLAHSVGMQKGLYGVVNVFATDNMVGSNDTVTAHELLHTLGAVDKYDPRTSQPLITIGYADPDQQPLLPQTRAELMAGRIPLTASESVTPESLQQVVIGPATAHEIGWNKD